MFYKVINLISSMGANQIISFYSMILVSSIKLHFLFRKRICSENLSSARGEMVKLIKADNGDGRGEGVIIMLVKLQLLFIKKKDLNRIASSLPLLKKMKNLQVFSIVFPKPTLITGPPCRCISFISKQNI